MRLVSKYATIQTLLFGIVGTRLLATAEISASVTSSSSCSSSTTASTRRSTSPLAFLLSKAKRKFATVPCINLPDDVFTKPVAALSSRGQQRQTILSIRAGGMKNNKAKQPPSKSSSLQQQRQEKIKKGFLLVASTITVYGLWHYRTTWMSLFNKEKLQASVVQTLESLDDLPYLYSRSFYVIAMALWETLGMSTIPVETAAAMVFGWAGFYWSGIGKLLGACLAFGLGRGALSKVVDEKLSSNTFLKLVQSSTEENPLLVVILIKLSCFPETVKNFGSSMLKPIRWWMFILGTAVHGWTFTALWTYLGVDTAARLKDTAGLLPPDPLLKTLLTLALINGCVVSPLSMVYWTRTLKQKQQQQTVAAAAVSKKR